MKKYLGKLVYVSSLEKSAIVLKEEEKTYYNQPAQTLLIASESGDILETFSFLVVLLDEKDPLSKISLNKDQAQILLKSLQEEEIALNEEKQELLSSEAFISSQKSILQFKTKKIIVEKDKTIVDSLIEETTPVINIAHQADHSTYSKIMNLQSLLVGWQHNCNKKVPNTAKDNKTFLEKEILKAKPLVRGKILGSGGHRTAIWTLYINSRTYVLFYNKRGLSIEALKGASPQEVCEDLLVLANHCNLSNPLIKTA